MKNRSPLTIALLLIGGAILFSLPLYFAVTQPHPSTPTFFPTNEVIQFPTGEPIQTANVTIIANGTKTQTVLQTWDTQFDFTKDCNTMYFSTGTMDFVSMVGWYDVVKNQSFIITMIDLPYGQAYFEKLSPDGSHIAGMIRYQAGDDSKVIMTGVFVTEVANPDHTQLIFSSANLQNFNWSNSGHSVAVTEQDPQDSTKAIFTDVNFNVDPISLFVITKPDFEKNYIMFNPRVEVSNIVQNQTGGITSETVTCTAG